MSEFSVNGFATSIVIDSTQSVPYDTADFISVTPVSGEIVVSVRNAVAGFGHVNFIEIQKNA